MSDSYFVKLTMANGADAWINLANVAFIYQNAGSQTTVRFSSGSENQISIKENLKDVAEKLPPL